MAPPLLTGSDAGPEGEDVPRSKVPFEDLNCLAREEMSGFPGGSRDAAVGAGGAAATFGLPFGSWLTLLGEGSVGKAGVDFLLRARDPSGSGFTGPAWRESTVGATGGGCCGHGPCSDFRATCLPSGVGSWEEAAATWVWEKIRWDLVIIWNTCICSWLTRDS